MNAELPSDPQHAELYFRVVGCLEDGFLYTLVGVGISMLDGGGLYHLPVEQFPADLRMPNSEFRGLWDLNNGGIVCVTERIFPAPSA